MFLRTPEGEIIDRDQLTARFPNCSIPIQLADADAEFLGVEIVQETPPPVLTDGQQAAVTGAELQADGKYYTTWTISRIPPEIQAARILMQIDDMETKDKTGRGAREALIALTLALATAQGNDEAWLIANNIAYCRLKQRDSEIRSLRAKYLLLVSEVQNG
jgi:hypothetical protein